MTAEQYKTDALPVPEQGTASYRNIHQLFKKLPHGEEIHNIFPVTYTQSVYDGKTGANLEHILHQFNHIFLQFQGTPQATRNLLPKDMRRKGIMISYRDMDNNVVTETNIDESESTSDNWGLDKYWVAYGINLDQIIKIIEDYIDQFFDDTLLEQVKEYIDQYFNDTAFEEIKNYIDEYLNGTWLDTIKEYLESLITEAVKLNPDDLDRNDSNEIQLADRDSTSGMGYVILRKNKTFAEQVTKENTIYEIRYDYDLGEGEVTIPENCILKFEGGSLSDGTIGGNNSKIVTNSFKIFKNITVKGTWIQEEVYSNWFFSEESEDSTALFKNLMTLSTSNNLTHIYIEEKTFKISLFNTEGSVENYEGVRIPSNVYIHNSATIKALPSDIEKTAIFLIHGNSNVTVDGGELIGDIETHIGDSGEWGYGISLVGASNITIKNITISKCWGDGINIQAIGSTGEEATHCKNITIDNVKCLSNRRQGMSIEGCIGALIINSEFSDTGSIKSTNPGAGIDIEPWFEEEIVTDIKIDNCRLFNNKTYLTIYGNHNTKGITISNCFSDRGVWIRTSNVIIDNFQCSKDSPYGYLAIWGICHNISVINSYFTNEIYAKGDLQDVSICNSTFVMNEAGTWSGYAICFENENENCKYKNINISDCSFTDTNKVRFLMVSSDELVDINFINNNVITGCTQPFLIGYGNFISNFVTANSANGISINNITGKTINIRNNNIVIQKYVDYILSFIGEPISSDSIYDCIIYNTNISVSSYYRVANSGSNNYKVLIVDSNLGGDLISQLYQLTNWTYKNTNNCSYSKEYTPLIINATEGKCYMYKVPYKRGKVTIFTSNKYTTKSILYNTITDITINPDLNQVDINPTHIISSSVVLDDTNNTEFPRIGYKIENSNVHIYIKNGVESVYGLRTKLQLDFQDIVEYKNINYSIIDVPEDITFELKLKGELNSSSISSFFTKYKGMKYRDSESNLEVCYDGTQWRNEDGTLTSKVTII